MIGILVYCLLVFGKFWVGVLFIAVYWWFIVYFVYFCLLRVGVLFTYRLQKITPVIDKVYPLEEVHEAFSRFEEGLHKGKIVITMNNA
jgi:hypothetical protein